MKSIGIYKITCLGNNKIYIGSTTVNFKKRFSKHKQRLRNNYHENSYMQACWNKYGENSFIFEILEEIEDSDLIKIREQSLLDHYFSNEKDIIMNLSPNSMGGNTIITEEQKIKHSEAVKKSYTPELLEKRRQIGIKNKDEFVKRVKESWTEDRLEKQRKSSQRLAKDLDWLRKMKKVNEHRQIKVCTDRDETFDSVTDAALKTGAQRGNIRQCIKGKIKTCMERKWYYYEEKEVKTFEEIFI